MHLTFQSSQTTKDFKRMSKLNALEAVGSHSQYLCDIDVSFILSTDTRMFKDNMPTIPNSPPLNFFLHKFSYLMLKLPQSVSFKLATTRLKTNREG